MRNGSLRASDLSAAARATLQGQAGPAGPTGPPGPVSAPHLLTAESNPLVDLEDCGGDLLDCPNLLTLALNTPVEPVPGGGPPGPASDIPKRDWLVQAKLVVLGQDLPDDQRNDCGLVIDGSTEPSGVLDIAQSRLSFEFSPGEFETVALMAAVPKRLKNPADRPALDVAAVPGQRGQRPQDHRSRGGGHHRGGMTRRPPRGSRPGGGARRLPAGGTGACAPIHPG